MVIKINKKSFFLHILFFCLVYINASLWSVDGITGTVNFILKFVLLIAFFFLGKMRFYKQNILCFAILSFFMVFAFCFRGIDFEMDIGALINLILATVFVCIIDERDFQKYFSNVMFFSAVCSLIGYSLYYLAPAMLDLFPKVNWYSGSEITNLFFAIVPLGVDDYVRNWGFFKEPGFFAVFLIFSLMIEMFLVKKHSFIRIVLEFVALVLTFSTAGILSGAMLIVAFLFSNINDPRIKRRILGVGIIGLATLVAWILTSDYGMLMFNRVTEKISENRNDNISYSIRVAGIEEGIELFMSNPITGVSHNKITKEIDTTQLLWFSLYGIFYGLICNVLCFTYVWKISCNRFVKLFVFGAVTIVLACQTLESNMFVFIILYYGLNGLYVRKTNGSKIVSMRMRENEV